MLDNIYKALKCLNICPPAISKGDINQQFSFVSLTFGKYHGKDNGINHGRANDIANDWQSKWDSQWHSQWHTW